MSGGTTISTSETRLEALQIQSSAYGVTIPLLFGVTRVSGNMLWYGGFRATAHTDSQTSGGKGGGGGVTQNTTTYTYSASVMLGLGEGPVSAIPRIWVGKKLYTDGSTSALAQLGLTLAAGTLGQGAWPYLTSTYPAQAIGYSGLAHVYAQDYQLGSSASVENHTFEVVGQLAGSVAGSSDVNPAAVAIDVLTNSRYGAGFPAAQLASFTDWSNYCLASGVLLSPAVTEQVQAGEFLTTLANITNTAPVWTSSGLKMIPYGDAALSGNGATYTPNNTPVYDLTDDDFTPSSAGDDPIRVTRKPQADAYNAAKVEFLNRSNLYNIEIAEAKDSANIDAYGLRTADTLSAHWICDASVARSVAQTALQRALYIRNTYTFNLPWTKALLEPMDLVTLTDSGLGFDKLAVRITEVDEEDDVGLTVTAEEFPIGVASAAIYPTQTGAGYQHNYNAEPGDVLAPFVFEAPIQRTTTGLEVYAAVRGQGPNWGGARVWVSMDGTNYKDSGLIFGGARYGQLTGAIAGGALPVLINGGQMLSGSAADSAALTTLCYVGGANPEYLAYTTATLTAANAYTLGGLTRAAFKTNGAAHSPADPFARIDDALAKSGPLDLSLIGQTIYFKFTSFNTYQGAEQSLANVAAYPYTITGAMAKLPPSDVEGFVSSISATGSVTLLWDDIADPDRLDFELRQGTTWEDGLLVTRTATLDYQMPAMPAASYRYWIAARDAFLNYSVEPASTVVVVAAPSAPTVSYMLEGSSEVVIWTIPTSGSLADRYELRAGPSWLLGTYLDTTKATSYRRKVDYVGPRTYWVAAVDVVGNYGAPDSVSVNITAPGVVTDARVEVVDNNALVYWGVPATGTLPVDRYEVRKGASWAAGAVVGSNGNSTFAAIFETVGGVYTYWIAAVDSAGNPGTAASVIANISQPPDYILRADANSAFGGTKTNALSFEGGLLVPVNTTETWAQHFANNGYATPQAQIAAGNTIYISPAASPASYTEVMDYGTTLPATTITVTLNSTAVAGAVTASCQIDYSNTSATGPWISAPAGATSVLASNFRWVRVTYTFTSSAGQHLLQVNSLNVKLNTKQRSDSGTGTVTNAATGVWVPFGYAFIDADLPSVQPAGSVPLIPAVDYADIPNPPGFTVYLYTLAGVKTTGSFSWQVKGY